MDNSWRNYRKVEVQFMLHKRDGGLVLVFEPRFILVALIRK